MLGGSLNYAHMRVEGQINEPARYGQGHSILNTKRTNLDVIRITEDELHVPANPGYIGI
jgi:hypothetical protein